MGPADEKPCRQKEWRIEQPGALESSLRNAKNGKCKERGPVRYAAVQLFSGREKIL